MRTDILLLILFGTLLRGSLLGLGLLGELRAALAAEGVLVLVLRAALGAGDDVSELVVLLGNILKLREEIIQRLYLLGKRRLVLLARLGSLVDKLAELLILAADIVLDLCFAYFELGKLDRAVGLLARGGHYVLAGLDNIIEKTHGKSSFQTVKIIG